MGTSIIKRRKRVLAAFGTSASTNISPVANTRLTERATAKALVPFHAFRSVLLAKIVVLMMAKTRKRMSPEGSASGVLTAGILLPLLLPGEGRDLSVISFLLRAVQEVSRGAPVALPFTRTEPHYQFAILPFCSPCRRVLLASVECCSWCPRDEPHGSQWISRIFPMFADLPENWARAAEALLRAVPLHRITPCHPCTM